MGGLLTANTGLTTSSIGYNGAGKFSINAYNGVTTNYHSILLNEGGGGVALFHYLESRNVVCSSGICGWGIIQSRCGK